MGYLQNLMLTFGRRILSILLRIIVVFIHFLCTGWMPTSRAGSYDGNWSLIVGCLPCVVGYHLQLVVFLIGSHLWLGNIGKKNRFQRITYPENDRMPSHVPQKRDHLQKRLHLPTLGFSPGYSCVLGGKDLVLKLRAETSSSSNLETFELGRG